MPERWTERELDSRQTALFDVVMGDIVPSLKACDEPAPLVCPACGSDNPAITRFDGDELIWQEDADYAYCPDEFHAGEDRPVES